MILFFSKKESFYTFFFTAVNISQGRFMLIMMSNISVFIGFFRRIYTAIQLYNIKNGKGNIKNHKQWFGPN